jgi:hypothetical protein
MIADGSRFSMVRGRLYFIALWLAYFGIALAAAGRHAHSPFENERDFFGGVLLALFGFAWFGYWYILKASPYLRPRSLFRERSYCGRSGSCWFCAADR